MAGLAEEILAWKAEELEKGKEATSPEWFAKKDKQGWIFGEFPYPGEIVGRQPFSTRPVVAEDE
jgi:hypothetical protein